MDRVVETRMKQRRQLLLSIVVIAVLGYFIMSTKVSEVPNRVWSPFTEVDINIAAPPPLPINVVRSKICIGMRDVEPGIAFTTNADRVRALSTAAAVHIGGYTLLPAESLWNATLLFEGARESLRRFECEWVVLVGLHVILVPSATDLLSSLLANAKGDVVAFHSTTNTKAIDFHVLALRAHSKGADDILANSTIIAELEQRLLSTTGVSVASIATVLKKQPNDSVRLPFEVAGIQRSAAICESLVLDVFQTFTPGTMPVPCSGMSAKQCWSGSCENSGDIYFPESDGANVCIIHSKGGGAKTKFMGPLNVLSWHYYVALHGYKMHSYEPRERDAYLFDGHRTKLNELIVSLQDPDCSWVMWSDDDTVVVNFEITLESIIQEFAVSSETAVIGAWDKSSQVVNSGNFFIKRSRVGARFMMRFRKWMLMGFVVVRKWKDNTDFIHLIETSEFSPYTAIAPQEHFNAYFTTKTKQVGWYAFNPQTSLLIHYPGGMSAVRAVPTCSLLPPRANTLLTFRNYSFCEERRNVTSNVTGCFEHYCKNGSFSVVKPVTVMRKHTLCVVTPPLACSHSFNTDQQTCADCRYVAAPIDTPCDGTLPADLMSELNSQCLWTAYPLDSCLDTSLVKAKLMANAASVVMGRGEDSKVAVGFVAVKGDRWGNMYVRHVENFHTLQLATPAIEDPKEVIQFVGTSRKFLARLDRVPLSAVCLEHGQ